MSHPANTPDEERPPGDAPQWPPAAPPPPPVSAPEPVTPEPVYTLPSTGGFGPPAQPAAVPPVFVTPPAPPPVAAPAGPIEPTPPVVPSQPVPEHDQTGASAFAPGAATVPSYPAPPAYPSPYAAAQTSAPPTVGYGQPVSGGPYQGPGYPAYPAVAASAPPAGPPRRGRGWIITLSILLALFLLATGVLTTLYVTKSGEYAKTKKDLTAQVSDRDTKLAAQGIELEQAKKDMQTTKDELADAKQALTGTQNTADELKRQKAVISKCLNLLGEGSQLADEGKTSAARAKFKEAEPVCDEADKYLD
ncbi:MAG TPA: hypothetical protein VFE14_09135 [Micromonosporaceae bacterium]|nr:hypothetical protein [Micromonosporaceae bacterium]